MSEHSPWVFHERKHPAAPRAICCGIGKLTYIKISPAGSDVIDPALMAGRTEAHKKRLVLVRGNYAAVGTHRLRHIQRREAGTASNVQHSLAGTEFTFLPGREGPRSPRAV